MNSSTPIRNGNYGSPARNQATRNRNAIVFAESSFTTPPRNDLRDRRLLSPPAIVQNNHRSRRPRLSQSTRNFSEFAFNLDACLAQLNISSGRNIDIDDTFVVNKDDEELDCEVADINATTSTSSSGQSSTVSSYTLPFRLSGRGRVDQASPNVAMHHPQPSASFKRVSGAVN